LQEIKVTEGTTVGVNTVVGTIAVDGESAAAKPAAAPAKPTVSESSAAAPPAVAASRPRTPAQETQSQASPPAAQVAEEEARSSPLVRKIAREHNVSLSQVTGTGLGGRITKQDIMQFIENQGSRVGTDAFVRPAERSEATPTPAASAPAPRP